MDGEGPLLWTQLSKHLIKKISNSNMSETKIAMTMASVSFKSYVIEILEGMVFKDLLGSFDRSTTIKIRNFFMRD